MVVSICTVWSHLSILGFYVYIISANSADNKTTEAANSTAPVEQNSTFGFTDISASTEPTAATTLSSYRPTEQPPEAAEPLPVSGSLLTLVADGKLPLHGYNHRSARLANTLIRCIGLSRGDPWSVFCLLSLNRVLLENMIF